jgi:hypothetical protein
MYLLDKMHVRCQADIQYLQHTTVFFLGNKIIFSKEAGVSLDPQETG